ncbi:hypothetical protein K431DRAFT_235471, partial [Polychaeton citri CBS 116435]
SIYQTSEHSDLTITCGASTFKVHKAILCAQSDYFRNARKRGTFLASALSTPRRGHVSCDEPETVRLLIEYFYHLDYNANSPGDADRIKEDVVAGQAMVVHAKVFALAVKYQVPGLRTLAVQKFRENMTFDVWPDASLAETIGIVFARTPGSIHDLRALLCDACLRQPKVLSYPAVREVVRENAELAYELLSRKCGNPATYK